MIWNRDLLTLTIVNNSRASPDLVPRIYAPLPRHLPPGNLLNIVRLYHRILLRPPAHAPRTSTDSRSSSPPGLRGSGSFGEGQEKGKNITPITVDIDSII